ncbi:MAG TPA: phosphatidylglycerophosphatase A, partial [Candidatus Desulfofervidus auxilii]|nr:phosphatidylglycerophosphatase A [Candidatus Desulfofervidus auxilii]
NKFNFTLVLATGFGVGYLPGAPGTYGSFLALIIYFFLPHSLLSYSIFMIFAIILGIFSAHQAEKTFKIKDPSQIVIDEMLGYWVALWNLPPILPYIFSAFFLFRFFDIIKPYPICSLEKLRGGIGIIFDDLMAGFYSWCILQLAKTLVSLL